MKDESFLKTPYMVGIRKAANKTMDFLRQQQEKATTGPELLFYEEMEIEAVKRKFEKSREANFMWQSLSNN